MSDYIPKAGDHFTVVRWTPHRDNSYRGDALLCTFVEAHLIRCKRVDCHPGGFLGGEFTLDANRVELMPLSAEFVERAQWKESASA